MPSRNTHLVHGERYNPLTKELYNDFIKETGISVDFKTFSNSIIRNNEIIGNAISEEAEGVQLPHLGYICVSKFKQRADYLAVDPVNSKKFRKTIPFLNLHSFGFIHYIKWFKVGIKVSNIYIWKLQPLRKVKRGLAKQIKSGKQFFEWSNSDLWHSSKLERMFKRKFKQGE